MELHNQLFSVKAFHSHFFKFEFLNLSRNSKRKILHKNNKTWAFIFGDSSFAEFKNLLYVCLFCWFFESDTSTNLEKQSNNYLIA